jgi:hypothetical protein
VGFDRGALPPRNLVTTLLFSRRLNGADEPGRPVRRVDNFEFFLAFLFALGLEPAKVPELL